MSEPETVELEVVTPTAMESIERANIDMQITTARKFPRSLTTVKRRMMDLATLDEETAESCFYKLSRSGKAIEGPSIRLAEIAASSFGNLRYGARTIGNDGHVVTSQAFCHDLETNVLCTVETQRSIKTKEGRTYSQDMQVTTSNAAGSIALRNAIFKVVPFALIKPIYLAAKQTAVGDLTTLVERRTKMFSKFAAMGVDQKRIVASVGKNGVEEIGLTELETLIGVYSAIRDNEQTIDEAFPTSTVADIKFGEAGTPNENPATPPKRHRRTKAEMEAAKAAETVTEGASEIEGDQPNEPEQEEPRTSLLGGNGSLKAPIVQLRAKLIENDIAESQLKRYLITEKHIDPADRLEKLPDEKLLDIVGSFDSLLPAIRESMK